MRSTFHVSEKWRQDLAARVRPLLLKSSEILFQYQQEKFPSCAFSGNLALMSAALTCEVLQFECTHRKGSDAAIEAVVVKITIHTDCLLHD